MSFAHSVRFPLRLGQDGYQDIEAITQHDCAVKVEAEPGNDGEVIVHLTFAVRGKGVHPEGRGDHAVPYAGYDATAVRDRHIVRIGDGQYGCVRVLSHEVSPYDWRFVNFSNSLAEQQVNFADLSSLNAKSAGVESCPP